MLPDTLRSRVIAVLFLVALGVVMSSPAIAVLGFNKNLPVNRYTVSASILILAGCAATAVLAYRHLLRDARSASLTAREDSDEPNRLVGPRSHESLKASRLLQH